MFRLFALGLGVLLALIVSEVALHFYEPPRLRSMRLLTNDHTNDVYHCYSSNPNGEFEELPHMSLGFWSLRDDISPLERFSHNRYMVKDAHETPWAVRVQRTRIGPVDFRDWKYEKTIPPGMTRIVLAGDSFVFGQGVPLELTMSRKLNEQLGKDVQVVNGGVPGLNTHHEVQCLDVIREELDFDSVVLVFIPNDISLNSELMKQQEFINDFINVRDGAWQRSGRRWYAGHFALFELVGSYVDMRMIERDTRQWYLNMYDPRTTKRAWTNWRTILSNWPASPTRWHW